MTTRPSRSASIPIPRNSTPLSPRNIESVISIPFVPPARPRLANAQAIPQRPSVADDHRGVGGSHTRGSSSSGIATSPTRLLGRPASYAAGIPMRPRPMSTFEPRVVRAGTDASRSTDAVCLPSSSTSPSRARRSSIASGRATSAQRQSLGQTVLTPPPPPVSFARPAYLEHSALRHMLQTDAPPSLPPSRKAEAAAAEAQSYTVAMSPTTDSDEESNVSPPRELPSVPLPPPLSQDQILKLPTRWSEQFRHSLLSVSDDGRDLTYHG